MIEARSICTFENYRCFRVFFMQDIDDFVNVPIFIPALVIILKSIKTKSICIQYLSLTLTLFFINTCIAPNIKLATILVYVFFRMFAKINRTFTNIHFAIFKEITYFMKFDKIFPKMYSFLLILLFYLFHVNDLLFFSTLEI